jgi:hypothetical protein
MPTVGFETAMPAGERLHTYALERAATGTSITHVWSSKNFNIYYIKIFTMKPRSAQILYDGA